MNTANRERILIIASLACLVLLVGDKLILSPMLNAWTTRADAIEQLENDLFKGRLLLEREEDYRARWQAIREGALPKDISSAENLVLKSVDRWVNQSRINLVSFKPQWKQTEEDWMSLECRAIAQGNMESVVRFLYEIETETLPLRITGLELSSKDETGQIMTFGIEISAIRFMEEQNDQQTE
ncbi:MAG: hypothetical protein RBU29_15085 [bacterium]|jgi:hypothetical protein|nr:hypothetical protein [bacterium]